ncbi:hypothetical protein COCOBI_10-0820 [Coccomyxa sp. Obi]|nr:hypothetical protein COCOBI_10-0820 [Coccomyxa sp. Obi]
MKPCYRHKGKLYLLVHLIREGGQFPQPCKALISPGKGPAVTRVTGEFLRRCGWLNNEAVPPEKDNEAAISQRAESSNETAQLVHCKLVVGNCHLNTVLRVVEAVDFSNNCVLSRWHIHIGRKDFEALQENAWDLDICYLCAKPELDQVGSRPTCPLHCDSFTTALQNGHRHCLRYCHMATVEHHRKGRTDAYYSIDAAKMLTAEVVLYEHDVLGTPWRTLTCPTTATFGSIDCLSYAHASGCPWDSWTCQYAAAAGKLHCLAYAHEHGCGWDTGVLLAAACNGHLECLKYAHTHGCPYTTSGLVHSYWIGPAPSYLTTHAAFAPSMPCLVYVREVMGCTWDPKGSECRLAFERGNLKLLQYIHSHGGVLHSRFELLCKDEERWLDACGIDAERKAECLLYVLSYGGCQVEGIWHTRVGQSVLKTIKARREAVLLSFHVAGKACVGSPMIALAHAAMRRMPSDIVHKIM